MEDGLASNYPHLSLLDELRLKYITGVKTGDHKFLFDWIKHAKGKEVEYVKDKVKHKFRYVKNVPLNDANFNYRVNVLEYWEEKANGKKKYFSWVTSLEISDENVYEIMRLGRARWKVENETFNTLKNQGYNFKHNYGHGYENLCSVMTMLMMLAFLIDQIQQLCDKFYKKVLTVMKKQKLFEHVKVLIFHFTWESWNNLYRMLYANARARPK